MENIPETGGMTRLSQTDWSKIPAIKIGQHIQLSPSQISMYQTESVFFSDIKVKTSIELVKFFDKAMVNAIINKAIENGITDLFVLNEDFILSALREKMVRDGNKKRIIDLEAWTAKWKRKESPWNGYTMVCSKCGGTIKSLSGQMPFCPACGRAMTKKAWVELETRLRE